ncbi:MAG: DNA translocase FtsK 4TM domain-containing protein [Anaerolineae bacterium]|nr:DNA translocase FtsK 4TM domain-containing protein [Anaerolineae bacterium]
MTLDQKLDALGWCLLIVGGLSILSLFSGGQGDLTGWWLAILSQTFGWGMYVVPLFLGAMGLWLILRRFGDRIPTPDPEQVVGIGLGFLVALATMHLVVRFIWPEVDLYALGKEGVGGGMLGAFLLELGINAVGEAGAIICLLILWIVVITFIAGISPADAIRMLSGRGKPEPEIFHSPATQMYLPPETMTPTGPPVLQEPRVIGGNGDDVSQKAGGRRKRKSDEPEIRTSTRATNDNGQIEMLPLESQVWRLPDVSQILEQGSEQYFSEDLIRKQSRIIEETLISLGAPARVQEINTGPVVTQFGVEPLFLPSRSGKTIKVKVSKIAGLADDLALALSARSIRVQAPIPGKGLVGIEVPNEESAVVSLLDVMESEGFAKLDGRLRLGLGQDVSGQAVSADLRSMPHLLVAGATGSGKSVCVNSIIAALLLQNSPDTLRMLMVDPKRVELTQYNGIPHLLSPVIVDVEQVVPALRWVMREMDSRYRRFAKIGARNIDDFNTRVSKGADEISIPYITVLIDELADMMMQSPEETERVICRLAQMARATGIHLIIATQRPSVDVVTGLIKANFPARIAFAVASSVDSRVILDMPGAERLLGRGDMLFMPPDVSQPLRLQGAFVSDRELDKLISFWRNAVDPAHTPEQVTIPRPSIVPAHESVEEPLQANMFPDFDDAEASGQFEDPLLPTSVEIFLAENRASVSLLQRRLRIGYTRAARLVDLLTDMGIVTLEAQGQSRNINRAVAEALLQSVNPSEEGLD